MIDFLRKITGQSRGERSETGNPEMAAPLSMVNRSTWLVMVSVEICQPRGTQRFIFGGEQWHCVDREGGK
jgi:hypothetical protein